MKWKSHNRHNIKIEDNRHGVNKMAEPISINISEGGAFFAHEMSANFSPTQIFLDFKMVSPRVDPRGKGKPSFLMQHNVVMLEPWHAKKIIEVMGEVVKKYEGEYGKIKKPKAVEVAEKKQKDKKTTPEEAPHYFG